MAWSCILKQRNVWCGFSPMVSPVTTASAFSFWAMCAVMR